MKKRGRGKKKNKLTLVICLSVILFVLLIFLLFFLINRLGNIRLAPITVNGGGQAAIVNAINQANPGDTIEVMPGNYDDGSINDLLITKSGTAGSPITMMAIGSPRAKLGNIKFQDASYWILDGFEIGLLDYSSNTGGGFGAIEIDGSQATSNNIIIKNMYIHDISGHGIRLLGGDQLTVQNSTISNTINKYVSVHQGAHAIEVIDAHNSKILNNTLFGFMADAVQMRWVVKDANNNGVPLDRGTTLIEGNDMYNTQGPCAENALDIKSELGTVIFRKNKAHGFEPLTGIGCIYQASGDPTGTAIVTHENENGILTVEQNEFYNDYGVINTQNMQTTVKNNIFHDFNYGTRVGQPGRVLGVFVAVSNKLDIYHNTFKNIPSLFDDYTGFGTTGIDVINNLFYNEDRSLYGNYNHNGWYGTYDRVAGTGDVLGVDPLINADYSLKTNSPLIDKAIGGVGVTNDYRGTSRPQGPFPDISAFENTSLAVSCIDNDLDSYGNGCALGLDCNDNNPNINPGRAEICGNLIDENCNTNADDICPGAIRFAAIGDYGTAGQNELDVANLVKNWSVNFIITLGDNNYPNGASSTIDPNIGQYYHDYILSYSGSYGTGSAIQKFFPSLGNHDWNTAGAVPYLNYFTLPGNERYYDFISANIHFFIIDSDPNELDGTSSSSVQAQWLQNALSASTSKFDIVYFHHPPYSSGKTHGSTAYMQWPFQAWGADIVLAGHEHLYERLTVSGFPYIVNGLGGTSIYPFNPPISGSIFRYNNTYGAMVVDVNQTTALFKFVNKSSTVIDAYSIVSAPTGGSCLTTDPALKLYTSFDDGTANDQSGKGHNGVLFNGVAWTSAGKFGGGAFSFDGVNDYIEFADNNDFHFGTGDFTFTAWIKNKNAIVDPNHHQPILVKSDFATGQWGFDLRSGQRLRFHRDLIDYAVTTSSLNDDVWHHVAIKKQGDNLVFYIDGQTAQSFTGVAAIDLTNTINLYIGARQPPSVQRFFNGIIDEVMMFSRALTDAEITSIYNNQLCTVPVCGNGLIESGETCDDGNALGGDGCSSACAIEAGYTCAGQPSVCTNPPPVITAITNLPPSVNPSSGSTKDVVFQFSVQDNDINDNSATAKFSKTGEPDRTDSLCSLVGNTGGIKTFECGIAMQFYDASGIWNVEVRASDSAGNTVVNNANTFQYNLWVDIALTSHSVSFGNVNAGNSSILATLPTTITNLGNYVGTIQITGRNLYGNIDSTKFIGASAFRAHIDANVCTAGITLTDGTARTITGSSLSRGASATEQIYYCLTSVPSVPAQQYATLPGQGWTLSFV